MSSSSSGAVMVEQQQQRRQHQEVAIAPCILPPPRSWFLQEDDDVAAESSDAKTTATSECSNVVVAAPQQKTIAPPSSSSNVQTLPEIRETPVSIPPLEEEADENDENKTTPTPQAAASCASSMPTQQQQLLLASPSPAPSWQELSKQVLPAAARELLSTALQRLVYVSRRSAAACRWQRAYTDYYQATQGYYRNSDDTSILPTFSTLPWVDRQMVAEWRTYLIQDVTQHPSNNKNANDMEYGDDDDDGDDDEELEFQRARTLVPPPLPRPVWQHAEACRSCRKTFGPALLRHHCRSCGHSFCNFHASHTAALYSLQYTIPERVCTACYHQLQHQATAERIAWRLARCRDLRHHTLAPYFDVGVDSVEDAALRITHAALAMAKAVPLGAQATVTVETLDVLRKYGLNGIYTTIMLRQEFLAAADLLLKVLGIDREAFPLSVHELAAAIFYAFCEHRAARGSYPELEHSLHQQQQQQQQHDVSNADMDTILLYAPMALQFVYMPKAVDMQLLAAQQGWRLLYAHLDPTTTTYSGGGGSSSSNPDECTPASALFVHATKQIACLSIRGTSTIQDVITDIRQVPVPFPEEDTTVSNDDGWETIRQQRERGLAVSGMASAAANLYREHIDALLVLSQAGYQIRLAGHSLGGSVATLLGVLLRKELPTNLHVYAYGSPSCADLELAQAVEPFCTSIVLHDDVIPRLTPTSCRSLLKHLLMIRETWVKTHFADDIKAFTDRAKLAWAPRFRGGFTLQATAQRYCRKKLRDGKKYVEKKLKTTASSSSDGGGGRIIDQEDDYLGSSPALSSQFSASVEDDKPDDYLAPTLSSPPQSDFSSSSVDMLESQTATPESQLTEEAPVAPAKLSFDGDEFFDPEEDSDDESQSSAENEQIQDAASISRSFDAEAAATPQTINPVESNESFGSDESPGAVVLEETPLPDMYIPGKIVHIYSHRGVYKASYVARDFSELRTVSLAPNLLTDHRTKNYYDALLEVMSVRHAAEEPPQWTTFDGDKTCACCASEFTWASTSKNKAQEARDKHNCRSCGALVCDPCSQNRVPVPSIGLSVPSRICDRCYNDMGSSCTTATPKTNDRKSGEEKRPVRQREKRSSVVDELASRVQAAALKC